MTEQLTQHQRDEYIDASQRNAQEVLTIPEVQRRLGEYASELFDLTNSVVPATVVGGKVFTNAVDLSAVPATVVDRNEQLERIITDDPFDAHQLAILHQTYSDDEAYQIVTDFKRTTGNSPIYLPPLDAELAHTHAQPTRDLSGNVVRGRPMVIFNKGVSEATHVDTPVWFHELYHVKQMRKFNTWNINLLRSESIDLSWELEAYAISAMTILGIQDAGRQSEFLQSMPAESIDRVFAVDDIRQHVNRFETDQYSANCNIATELAKNGLGITRFLQTQIDEKS